MVLTGSGGGDDVFRLFAQLGLFRLIPSNRQYYITLWYASTFPQPHRLQPTKCQLCLLVHRNSSDVVVVEEGLEPPEFWDVLGGPEPYATGASLEVGCVHVCCVVTHCAGACCPASAVMDLAVLCRALYCAVVDFAVLCYVLLWVELCFAGLGCSLLGCALLGWLCLPGWVCSVGLGYAVWLCSVGLGCALFRVGLCSVGLGCDLLGRVVLCWIGL